MPHVVDPTLRPIWIHVYAALKEYWEITGGAHGGPSKDELMRACKCSMTSIMQATRELRNRGYIHAPKHAIRALRPTDMSRTISREPPDPWGDLEEPRQYWKVKQ
jgi:hypothetical protein